jgi:hypothetical protein
MFGDDILYTLDGTMQTLALARSFGDLCDPLFGTVDYTFGPTRYEDEHNLVSYDNFSLMRSRLRGFGWLTITPRQVVTALGGHDGLVHPTFARVEELAGGGFLLAATHRFNEYGDAARSRLEQFSHPYLSIASSPPDSMLMRKASTDAASIVSPLLPKHGAGVHARDLPGALARRSRDLLEQ